MAVSYTKMLLRQIPHEITAEKYLVHQVGPCNRSWSKWNGNYTQRPSNRYAINLSPLYTRGKLPHRCL